MINKYQAPSTIIISAGFRGMSDFVVFTSIDAKVSIYNVALQPLKGFSGR